jgi:hypothetical protein
MNVGFMVQLDRRLMPFIPTVEQLPMRWLVHGSHDRVGKDDCRPRQEFVEMRPREPTGSQSSPVRPKSLADYVGALLDRTLRTIQSTASQSESTIIFSSFAMPLAEKLMFCPVWFRNPVSLATQTEA